MNAIVDIQVYLQRTISYIKLKNGQTYFKNLAVLTTHDFLSMLDHFLNIIHERVNWRSILLFVKCKHSWHSTIYFPCSLLISLKISENQRFPNVSRRNHSGTLGRNVLIFGQIILKSSQIMRHTNT